MQKELSDLPINKFIKSFKTVIEKAASSKSGQGALLLISIENHSMIINSIGTKNYEDVVSSLLQNISDSFTYITNIGMIDRSTIGFFIGKKDVKNIEKIGNDIYANIQNYTYNVTTIPIHINAAIGGVIYPDKAKDYLEAIDKALVAIDEAKKSHKNIYIYGKEPGNKTESKNNMIMANYMQTALLNNKLCMAYQPIVNRKTGDTEWYECLLRIIDEDGTTSTAGPFIPIAEKMGFIDVIDTFVLQKVMKELENAPDLKLAFNISSTTIQKDDWIEMMVALLKNKPQIASRIIVEITETGDIASLGRIQNFIDIVHNLGCKIALDDFGMGNTSIHQIKELPLDIVKIDGSYVRDIVTNEENRNMIKALIEMTNGKDIKSVAEFVESKDIVDILAEMNIDFMQGNYFSPAVNYRAWNK